MRVLPDENHTVDGLKRFVASRLREIFCSPVRHGEFQFQQLDGRHIPAEQGEDAPSVFEVIEPETTVRFARVHYGAVDGGVGSSFCEQRLKFRLRATFPSPWFLLRATFEIPTPDCLVM